MSFNTSWWGEYGHEWTSLRNLPMHIRTVLQDWADKRGNDALSVAVRAAIPYFGPFLGDLIEVVRQVSHDESADPSQSRNTFGTRLSDVEQEVRNLKMREATAQSDLRNAIQHLEIAKLAVNTLETSNSDLFLRLHELERRFNSELSPRLAQERNDVLLGR